MVKVFLIGNLAKDVELKKVGDKSLANFDVAVQRQYADKDGNKKVDFFTCDVYGIRADNCAKYLSKGKKVAIDGTLQNSEYEKNGEKRVKTKIYVNEIEFLTPKNEGEKKGKEKPDLEEIEEGVLPF